MIPAGFGVVHNLKNKSRMSQLHFYFVYRMQKMQKLLRWIIFIQFLLVSCVVFAQENTASSTSEASSSHLSAIVSLYFYCMRVMSSRTDWIIIYIYYIIIVWLEISLKCK
jgi:hypothetical protein